MTEYTIVHQNLMNYGGGIPKKNDKITEFIENLLSSYEYSNSTVVAIAFTEIRNYSSAWVGIERAVRSDIYRTVLINIGYMALSRREEYISISLHKNFEIDYLGTIYSKSNPYSGKAYSFETFLYAADPDVLAAGSAMAKNFPPWMQTPVDYAEVRIPSPDQRGIALVLGRLNGEPVILGFVHNQYTVGNNAVITDGLPDAMISLEEALRAMSSPPEKYLQDNTFALIGGDWNITPRIMGNDRRPIRFKPLFSAPSNGYNQFFEKSTQKIIDFLIDSKHCQGFATTRSNLFDFWATPLNESTEISKLGVCSYLMDAKYRTGYIFPKDKDDENKQLEETKKVTDHSCIICSFKLDDISMAPIQATHNENANNATTEDPMNIENQGPQDEVMGGT